MERTKIFLVDDDALFLKTLEIQFKDKTNYDIRTFSSGEECLKNLYQKPDIIFLDYYLDPGNNKITGLNILDRIKIVNSNIEVIILSSQESIDIALNCIKHNALDYIIKSEATFIRAQKSIRLYFDKQKLEKELNFAKISAIVLAVLVPAIVIVAVYMQIHYPGIM